MTSPAAQSWRAAAACLSPAVNPVWFDDTVAGESPQQQTRRHTLAREVCGTCTVVNQCYAEGRTRREENVWGGRLMPKSKQGPPYTSIVVDRRRAS